MRDYVGYSKKGDGGGGCLMKYKFTQEEFSKSLEGMLGHWPEDAKRAVENIVWVWLKQKRETDTDWTKVQKEIEARAKDESMDAHKRQIADAVSRFEFVKKFGVEIQNQLYPPMPNHPFITAEDYSGWLRAVKFPDGGRVGVILDRDNNITSTFCDWTPSTPKARVIELSKALQAALSQAENGAPPGEEAHKVIAQKIFDGEFGQDRKKARDAAFEDWAKLYYPKNWETTLQNPQDRKHLLNIYRAAMRRKGVP